MTSTNEPKARLFTDSDTFHGSARKCKQELAYRQNRKEANGYLQLIQKRINRGHLKGAKQLFERWVEIAKPLYWESIAFCDRLDRTQIRSMR